MIFTPVEIEEVLNVYQDESQNPEYISETTGLDLDKVIKILQHLQSQGDIEGFNKIERRKINENRVFLFIESAVDPDVIKSLKLDKINDEDYFFDEKVIDEVYDAHIFEAKVEKIILQPGGVIINMIVTHKMHDFEISIIYTPDDNVYYADKNNLNNINNLKNSLGNNWELFDEVTNQILDDHIPIDFWEVRNRRN